VPNRGLLWENKCVGVGEGEKKGEKKGKRKKGGGGERAHASARIYIHTYV